MAAVLLQSTVRPANTWLPECFSVTDESNAHIAGWVSSEENLKSVIEAHRRTFLCSFVTWSDDKKKKEKGERRLLWQVNGIVADAPFTVDNTVILCCQYGKPHKRSTKAETQSDNTDHQYVKQKRFLIQKSRKIDCAAKIFIRRITRYDDYKVLANSTRIQRQEMMDTLSSHLVEGKIPKAGAVKCIYIKLPLMAAHTNHTVSIECGFAQKIHPEIRNKIHEYCSLGITSVPFLRRVLKQFVINDLCKYDHVQPMLHDRTYFPTRKDIQNHVHAALVAGEYSGMDQDNLEKKVDQWRESGNSIFLRKCTDTSDVPEKAKKPSAAFPGNEESSDSDDEIEEVSSGSFLFIHQSGDQKKLLQRYGDMVLLDATYKTTKYALPLFMVVVRTNVSYVPVAHFICETECTSAIAEALSILKEWNPDWKPLFFMLDYCDQEYQALQKQFPDAEKYLCAFHMEQAWNRWTRESKNGLGDDEKQFLLTSLRKIAYAASLDSYNQSVQELRNSVLYKGNARVKTYVESRWLNITKRWCRAFFKAGFHISVSTNNGVESLNNSLKQFYLKLTGSGTLTSLVDIIINEFVPDHVTSYIRQNYMFSSQYRYYNESVPVYLHNMPRSIVKHCLLKLAGSSDFKSEDIEMIEDKVFHVTSETSPSIKYTVDLGTYNRPPDCSCPSFRPSFLPCKHMFAIFEHTKFSWNDLSPAYRSSPYMTLDDHFLSENALQPLEKKDTQKGPVSAKQTIEEEDTPKHHLVSARSSLRENLKLLSDISFLCPNEFVLKEVNVMVVQLLDIVKRSVPTENNLMLHQGETVKRPVTKKQTRQLPMRKKRKKKRVKQWSSQTVLSGLDVCGNTAVPTVPETTPYTETKTDFLDNSSDTRVTKGKKVMDSRPGKKARITGKAVAGKENSASQFQHIQASDKEEPAKTHGASVQDQNSQKGLAAVRKLWSQSESCNYIVAKVGYYNVTDADFRSLEFPSLLTDTVIDAYLEYLVQIQLDRGRLVSHYPTKTMTSIVQGTFELRKEKTKLKVAGYSEIVGAYYLPGHWTLLIIQPDKGKINFYNPISERRHQCTTIGRNWRNYMGQRLALYQEHLNVVWEVVTHPHTSQKDGYNCGVFCLLFADRYFEEKSLENIADQDLADMRLKVANDLMLYEVYLSDACPACGCTVKAEELAVTCRKCGRKFHVKNHCLGNPIGEELMWTPDSLFQCKMCEMDTKTTPAKKKKRKKSEI